MIDPETISRSNTALSVVSYKASSFTRSSVLYESKALPELSQSKSLGSGVAKFTLELCSDVFVVVAIYTIDFQQEWPAEGLQS